MHDPDDDDDDSAANTDGPVDFTHDLDEGNDFDMTDEANHIDDPPSPITAILTAVESQLRLRTPETNDRARYPHLAYAPIDDLLRDPFFTTIFRDSDYSVIRFPSGRITSCLTVNHDRARSHYLSPERPALPQPRRRATPRYEPDSPPHETDHPLQDDITYDLSTRSVFESSSTTVTTRPTKPRSPTLTLSLPSLAPPSPREWGNAPLHTMAAAPAPWHVFTWGRNVSPAGPDPEPQPWGSRCPPSHSSSDFNPDNEDDHTHLQQYVQTASLFKGGTTVNAIGHVRDTRNSN
jgi:hypothetical protein